MMRSHRYLSVLLGLFFAASIVPLAHATYCPEPSPDASEPWEWGRDDLWQELQERVLAERASGCQGDHGAANLAILEQQLDDLADEQLSASDERWDSLQAHFFITAADVAACDDNAEVFARHYRQLRNLVKTQSRNWDMDTLVAKKRIYGLLYGGRTALEEIMVQLERPWSAAFRQEVDASNPVASATPSVEFMGVTLHSGDMLVSKGGAPASALIARGQDRPGNFSHVAQVYIVGEDQPPIDKRKTKYPRLRLIEAHIEIGVAVSTMEQYIDDRKLRLMLIRVRPDHPELKKNPMLPHRAAQYAFHRATTEHIPYDFKMNYEDPDRLFCSEVASNAYHENGINLWEDDSILSGRGVTTWLSEFGVECFELQEPSDLEYDPQVSVVAEWRNADDLVDDRISSAVVDVMLEHADRGADLSYNRLLLPVGWMLKFYSIVKNKFNKSGPIPEGMSTKAALKNLWFTARQEKFADQVRSEVTKFKEEKGYEPPYWELVAISRKVLAQ